MSAIYAVRIPKGIGILSDAAAVSLADGVLRYVESKVWTGGSPTGGGFALGFIGHPYENAARVRMMTMLPSFEAVEAMLQGELKRLSLDPSVGPLWSGVILAGYSEDRGKPSILYANFSDEDPHFAPWSITDVGREFSRGTDPGEVETRRIFDGISVMDEQALQERGAAFFKAQRCIKMDTPGYPPYFGIGGAVDLTLIDGTGTRQRRLLTWPEDVVGQVIDPNAQGRK